MAKKRKKSQEDTQLAQFILYVASGYEREEVIALMGLGPNEFESLYGKYYDRIEAEIADKSATRIYAEFVQRQHMLMKDLQGLKAALANANWKNGQAYVAAVRTQSEILDKVIKTGQELNLVEKRPAEYSMVGGMDPRDMDDEELDAATREELREASELLGEGGGEEKGKLFVMYPGKKKKKKAKG